MDYKEHNRRTLSRAKPGDMLQFHETVYSHWAIFVGDGKIVHLSAGDFESKLATGKGVVQEDNFWDVADGRQTDINNDKDSRMSPLPAKEIVKRARSKIGKVKYDLISQNCEHFAAWCRYGMKQSDQVDRASAVAGAALMQSPVGWTSILFGQTPAVLDLIKSLDLD